MDIDKLLSPEQREALTVIAAAQGRSVAEVFSDAIDQYVLREGGSLN